MIHDGVHRAICYRMLYEVTSCCTPRRGLCGPAGPWSCRREVAPFAACPSAPAPRFATFRGRFATFTQAPHKFLQGRSHAFAGVGVGVGSRRQKCHRITPPTQGPPPPRIAALPLRLWPHAGQAGLRGHARRHNAAKNLPSAGSKNSRPAGRFFGRQGQIVTKRFGNFFCHRRGKGRGNFRDLSLICHKGLFRPLISIFLGTLNPLFIRRVRPPGLEPGTN